jgi:hypothetical protein
MWNTAFMAWDAWRSCRNFNQNALALNSSQPRHELGLLHLMRNAIHGVYLANLMIRALTSVAN